MASVTWATSPRIISIPKTDLTLDRTDPVSGRQIFTYDVNKFHQDLRALEADGGEGAPFPDTHLHTGEATLAGITYVRRVEVLGSSFQITFEDGQYAVELTGGDSNIPEVTTVNQVQLRLQNSAGNITQPLLEADQVFDKSAALLHYYKRGTVIDLIPPKTVVTTQAIDTSLKE